ncbi:hypothetical protein Hanom_Chr11g00976571 [Helianthus anomalus]
MEKNGKISNLLDPDVEKQTFGRKSQNWPNLRDENGFYSMHFDAFNPFDPPVSF